MENNNTNDQENMETSKELSGEEKLLHLMDNADKDKKFTAEEKLLHVIENEKNGKHGDNPRASHDQSDVPVSEDASDGNTPLSQEIPEVKPGHPSFFSRFGLSKINPGNIHLKKISLATVNKMLIVAALIVSIIFGFYLLKEKNNIRQKIDSLKSKTIEKDSMPISLDKPNMPKIEDYTIASQKNNPFHILPESEVKDISEMIEKPLDLKLVGILWADVSEAIIEDITSGKTFIVNEGDTVGEYTIEKITQTAIILDSHGQKKTLK